MNDYKVYENQTLFDVAAHVYGRVDIVMDLALLNNLSVTEKLQAGQILKMVEGPINILVKKALDSRGIIPCTNTDIKNNLDFSGFPYEFAISF